MGISFSRLFNAFSHFYHSLSLSLYYLSIYKRSCPSFRRSVRPSVRQSVPSYFRKTHVTVFEGKKLSIDIINNDMMSDDEVVASHVPCGTCYRRAYSLPWSVPLPCIMEMLRIEKSTRRFAS